MTSEIVQQIIEIHISELEIEDRKVVKTIQVRIKQQRKENFTTKLVITMAVVAIVKLSILFLL